MKQQRSLVRLACAAAVTVVASATPAQRTWIVDARGGADFTDLPPAVAAANAGDLILIRWGPVHGTLVRRGLRILPQPSVILLGALVVENLPADETVVLGQFASGEFNEPQMILEFRDCTGRIHLGDVRFAPNGASIATRTYVRIERCASVTMYRCNVIDLFVRDSNVQCTRCIIKGDAFPRDTSDVGFPAIDCADSEVTLARCGMKGGVSFRDPPSIPGIRMQGGTLRITGSESTSNFVIGGATWNWTTRRWMYGPAIHSDGGLVELDPRVLLQAGAGAPLTSGTSRFVSKTMHYMHGRNPRQGESLLAEVYGPPGASAWTFASLPAHPTPWLLGPVWVDLGFVIPLGNGTIPAAGPLTFSVPLGNGHFPDGTVFALQSIILDQGRFSLTMPIVPILMPGPPP